nr:DUF4870 domain-containing protein [Arthrospira sp. PLM2.Bin9]
MILSDGGNMTNRRNQIDQESRTWGMIAHLSSFVGYVIPVANIVGPLVIWLLKKDEMPFVEDQAKEALNFQISILIYLCVSIVLILFLIGIPLLFAVLVFDLIFTIVAASKANEGIRYRYPLTLRFIK